MAQYLQVICLQKVTLKSWGDMNAQKKRGNGGALREDVCRIMIMPKYCCKRMLSIRNTTIFMDISYFMVNQNTVKFSNYELKKKT
ncbi:hypothetical protein CGH72_24095 [Vibrio parahaemolyticus]|uniref:hypothetical protein n=1 Tax=Vibrio TaxID=662 RepID=UPI0011202D8C|nr:MULTISPECIES: hypothetical protein [Vibrio]MBE3782248.1 hypothetical protein [Vibrio parahaemolyticus]MDW1850348.1 hypothetical protein [Vibrio sp. Vb0888]TOB48366.1 hypothetical protein CGK05_24015 [Vibrio parahaemolyticus]TOD64825.1 hypothetical protein CGJ60_08900 [Vibrio parahaemolyticus]TOM65584.1 hypothetical protein CGH72_24095 [Vibrio parahaemolyticus]